MTSPVLAASTATADEPLLSQAEIDALISAIHEGSIDLKTAAAETAEVELFDFTRQYRVAQKMPTLDLIHRRFATGLRAALGNMLGRNVEVQVLSTRTTPYGRFLASLPAIAAFSLFGLDPLGGYGMVVLHPGLISIFIDLLLGNRELKEPVPINRDLTAVELRLGRRIAESVLSSYREGWQAVQPLKLNYLRTEQASLFTPIAPNDEMVVVVDVEVTLTNLTESLAVVIPDASLEMVRQKLVKDFRITDPKATRSFGELIAERLPYLDVLVQVELGRMHARVADVVNLAVGDVLTLGQRVEDPLTAFVEGVPKFAGTTGSSGGSVALELTNRIEAH
ncbi:MAG: flagellar motor switch protein FliM [Deltaproteobacteria bacterium]|nr:flagellar motor switch protein FliM [Deltaproteobacteria bacterium]